MAFDLVELEQKPTEPLRWDFLDLDRAIAPPFPCKAPAKWRQAVFSIVHDTLSQLDQIGPGEDNHIWCREARQRALNFAELGLSPIFRPMIDIKRRAASQWDVTAIAVLGGTYRVLAKCNGHRPVQCENILRALLINLTSAYAPVYGKISLELKLCSLLLPPIKCRALILSVGMLLQAAIRQSCNITAGGHLEVKLFSITSTSYSLDLCLKGRQVDLALSPELELVSRLGGLFQSEQRYSIAEDNRLQFLITFPVPNISEPTLS